MATDSLTSTVAGNASVTASVPHTSLTQTASVTFSAVPVAATATKLSLVISPTVVAADGSSAAAASATVLDQNGKPMAGVTVAFSSSLGTLQAASETTNSSGVATDSLTSTVAGNASVTASVPHTSLTQTASVTFSSVQTGTSGVTGASPTPFHPAPQTASTGLSVGAGGGVLAALDGLFRLVIPSSVIPFGMNLTLTQSSRMPSHLLSTQVAAGPLFVLTGPALPQPQYAVLTYSTTALRGLSPLRVSVFQQTPSGWVFLPTSIDPATHAATVWVNGPGSLIAVANTQTFSDVPRAFWARPYIDTLLGAGVINGLPNGSFEPNAPVTRADFVKMLVLSLGLAPGSGVTGFHDVPANAWFAPYVSAAIKAGIVEGLTPTSFGPSAVVSREQMATFLARALHLPSSTAPVHFTDAKEIAPWALRAIGAAMAAGYLSGFPNGTFLPGASTTRAQAAKVLALLIDHRAPSSVSG